MQQGDFSSPYYNYHHPPHLQNPIPSPNPYPNVNPTDLPAASLPPTYASAPPFAPNYSSSDHTPYSSSYPPYPQNPDPVPNHSPTAPSYASNPSYQSFNPPPQSSSFASFHPAPEPQAPYQPPPPPPLPLAQQSQYYLSFDQNQTAPSYAPQPAQNSNSTPNQSFSAPYSGSYGGGSLGSSVPTGYENPYESNGAKFDHRGGGYFDENSGRYGGYGRSGSDLGQDFYDNSKRQESGFGGYDRVGMIGDDTFGDGVYAYEGGKVEPYGARGTSAKSSTWSAFDDYGRSISCPSGKEQAGSSKVVRAVPKTDTQQDVKSGVQKFRVKLLAESAGQSTMDVLCQIGLDGIHMLDPNTGRTLRIYPLDTVTRTDVSDSSIFTFWSKSSVDIEPRRIRLQSNRYTTNTILDIVTAATFQLKEMGGRDSSRTRSSDSSKTSEQTAEKKKGFGEWMNLIKPANEEKDHWVPDEAVTKCTSCSADFGAFVRKHHCRNCGDIFCDKCTSGRIALTADENAPSVRVCDRCMAEVTQRLSHAKESASKPAGLHSHEDLAKKLQEEMERNRKSSAGPKSSDNAERRMREVACPTCTVHLQVQVPSSGSETIECGVCQHPFLVSAH